MTKPLTILIRILMFLSCYNSAISQNTTIIINCDSSYFPALVNKIGTNQVWNEVKPSNLSNGYYNNLAKGSMFSTLYELNLAGTSPTNTLSTLDNPTPFYRPDNFSNIVPQLHANFTLLRDSLLKSGAVNFLQIAGTPTLPLNSNNTNLFALESTTYTGNGNFYPLPVDSQKQDLANGIAQLANQYYNYDFKPSVLALWQEPEHTLGVRTNGFPNIDKLVNLGNYGKFYRKVAMALQNLNQDFPISCCQQNQSAGNGNSGVLNGGQYLSMLDSLKNQELSLSSATPLDYFSIQNYDAIHSSATVMYNARYALTGNWTSTRFDNVPIIYNEYGADKNQSDSIFWAGQQGLTAFLTNIKLLLTQSDFSNILFPPSLYQPSNIAYNAINFLELMPELRNKINSSGQYRDSIEVLASSNNNYLSVLAWNKSNVSIPSTISFSNIPFSSIPNSFNVQQINSGVIQTPQSVTPAVTGNLLTLPNLTIPPYGVVMISSGLLQNVPSLTNLRYLRQNTMCYRTGNTTNNVTGSMPSSNGQFDLRTNTLWLSTAGKNNGNSATSSVIFKDISGSANNNIDFIIHRSNLSSAQNNPLYIRIDYLNGNSSLQTYVINPTAVSPANWNLLNAPYLPNSTATIIQNFNCSNGSIIPFDISANAPLIWTTADGGKKRVMITALLNGSSADDIVGVQIADNTSITGINELESNKNNGTLKAYPNPFNKELTVSFELNETSTVNLRIYDLLGIEKATIINERILFKGKYELLIDVSKFLNGIYFITLKTKEKNSNIRLIKIEN